MGQQTEAIKIPNKGHLGIDGTVAHVQEHVIEKCHNMVQQNITHLSRYPLFFNG